MIFVLSVMASSLASQLPQGFTLNLKFVFTAKHCGSWLASDGDRQGTIISLASHRGCG
ncbi:hypothetical protein [Pseudomonas fluorescens]|nr:hypothetical protein [Pseudomonas fluorescens]